MDEAVAETQDSTAITDAAGEPSQAQETAQPVTEQAESTTPEAYTFTAPEGMELDADAVSEFSTFATEQGLSQEQAQKVADIATSMAQRQQAQFQAQVTQWATDAAADQEFGGDKFQANLAIARTAIEKFGGDTLKQILDTTGLGNHPEMIRAFYRAGKMTMDSEFVQGGTAAPMRDPARIMFPTMN